MANTLGYYVGENVITARAHSVVVGGGQTLASLMLQLFNLLHSVCARLESLHYTLACECCGYKLINRYVPGLRDVCADAAAATVSCVCCFCSNKFALSLGLGLAELFLKCHKHACCAARFCCGRCGISIAIRLL